jgi:hypothetical protein
MKNAPYVDSYIGCENCSHLQHLPLFTICNHEQSIYHTDGIAHFHTAVHMRQEYGPCGPDKKLHS